MALCRLLLWRREDLLAVVGEVLNLQVSRSGVDRCLRGHEVGTLRDPGPKVPTLAHKSFSADAPGCLYRGVADRWPEA